MMNEETSAILVAKLLTVCEFVVFWTLNEGTPATTNNIAKLLAMKRWSRIWLVLYS